MPNGFDVLALINSDYFALMSEHGISIMTLNDAIEHSTNSSAETTQDRFVDWDGDGCWMFEDHDDDGDGFEEGPVNSSISEWWLYAPGDNCVIALTRIKSIPMKMAGVTSAMMMMTTMA